MCTFHHCSDPSPLDLLRSPHRIISYPVADDCSNLRLRTTHKTVGMAWRDGRPRPASAVCQPVAQTRRGCAEACLVCVRSRFSRTDHPPASADHSASGPPLCLFEHKVPGLFVEGVDSEQITAQPSRQIESSQSGLVMGSKFLSFRYHVTGLRYCHLCCSCSRLRGKLLISRTPTPWCQYVGGFSLRHHSPAPLADPIHRPTSFRDATLRVG